MARIRIVLFLLAAFLLLALPALAFAVSAPPEPKKAETKEPLLAKGLPLTTGNFGIAKGCEGMQGFTPCHRQMTSWNPARADVSE